MLESSTSQLAPQGNNPIRTPPHTRRPGKSHDTSSWALRTDTLQVQSLPNEAPPPYTADPVSPLAMVPPSGVKVEEDDPYTFLSNIDTVFLIDDSGSMAGTNWLETGKALELITSICTSRDADGIDIHFLNHPNLYKNVKTEDEVIHIFDTVQPGGGTPTGQRLYKILKPYLARYEAKPSTTKPVNLIVITDGSPSDDVESSIIEVAEKLDALEAPAWQVGIQFFQVGTDEDARNHLKYMDDNLVDKRGNRIRDIVDTVPFAGVEGAELSPKGVLKTVLGAVNRKLDRNSADLYRK